MESTKQIRSIRPIRGQKKHPPSLPFREGSGVGFLSGRGWGVGFFPSRSAANPQKRCFKCFKCFRCFRCFISLLDQKIARFWSKSEQNRCFRRFSCSKCSASLLPSFQGGAGGRLFPLTKREARLTKRACERLTKCEARLTHKKGVSGFQVQDMHNAS